MTINATEGFNQPLELFSGLFEDMAATDLPAGLSPDNQDVVYLPGNVGTRPGFRKALATSPEPTSDLLSLAEFAMPTGDYLTMWLYSSGNLWQQDRESGESILLQLISPGSRFRSVSAFNKQWFAFFNQDLSSEFSESPFCGADVPRYYDGKSLWRVTQDAPGIPPTFVNSPTLPIPLSPTASVGTLSISAARSSGIVIVRDDPPILIIWTTITYTATAPVPASWLNDQVTITGMSNPLLNVTGYVTSITGNNFVVNVGTGTHLVNVTGETGTATSVSNTYFTRQSNTVTAYFGVNSLAQVIPGLFVQISGPAGAPINGTNWTISSIARDSTGLVTITISTPLQNLPSGASVYIAASDSAHFPAGYQTVYAVLSTTASATTFTVSNPTWGAGAIATSSGGTVNQIWSGTFQVLSTGTDANGNNFLTYFQLGPDDSNRTAGSSQAQIQAQIPPGPRSAVLMFKSSNGAITAPSVPIQLSIAGGSNLLVANNVLIGPAGTAQRIIALTPAYGSSFYYITPATIPSAAGLSPVLSLGTIINDNAATSVILDFSDGQLTSGTQIDIQGNDLFNQIVLAPCLGCIEYEGRMGWWGEINNLKNLLNMGFDGGYIPSATSGAIGPNPPTAGITVGSGVPWNNPGNVKNSVGGLPTFVTLDPNLHPAQRQSQNLQATNFNLSASAEAGIGGFIVSFVCLQTAPPSGLLTVTLLANGIPVGTAKLLVPTATSTPYVLGSSSDTWGTTLAYTDVNSTSFGVQFSFSDATGALANQILLSGVSIAVYGTGVLQGALPPGWDASTAYNGITPDGKGTLVTTSDGLGFAYRLNNNAAGKNNCMISQTAYQDFYGGPILEPNRSYYVRFQGLGVQTSPLFVNNTELQFVLYSPSTKFLSTATFNGSSFHPNVTWMCGKLSNPMPNAIPNDLVFYIVLLTLSEVPVSATILDIDEIELIDVDEPVLFEQMRISYFDNPFGYDDISGVLSTNGSDKITGAFKQRGYLFALTDGPMYQTQNNGESEPDDWGFNAFADECDCFGPNAVTTTEDLAWWAGNSGFRVFSGATPKKLSQEIQRTWGTIDSTRPTDVWATNDPIERLVYVGFPVANTNPLQMKVIPMSYRSVDSAYNVPDPIHVGYSGKMIATDLCRKWTRWIAPMACASLLTIEGQKQVFFGGQRFGNFYSLDPTKKTDDDYGRIFSYYVTYFWFNHEIEQNAPGVGLHRKIDTYLSAFITGTGKIQPTALVNNLDNPWMPLETTWDDNLQMWVPGNPTQMLAYVLSEDQDYDLEWALNIRGLRIAYKWEAIPLAGETDASFLLQHMVLTCKEDSVTPVRGSVIG